MQNIIVVYFISRICYFLSTYYYNISLRYCLIRRKNKQECKDLGKVMTVLVSIFYLPLLKTFVLIS